MVLVCDNKSTKKPPLVKKAPSRGASKGKAAPAARGKRGKKAIAYSEDEDDEDNENDQIEDDELPEDSEVDDEIKVEGKKRPPTRVKKAPAAKGKAGQQKAAMARALMEL